MGEVVSPSEGPPGARACTRCTSPIATDTNFCPRCGADLRGTSATSDTYRGGDLGPKRERPPQTSDAMRPGLVIDGRYRLIERLGEGGMGSVYKVEHVRMGKVMALKILRRDLAQVSAVLERFRTEARIVARLSHPNTINVFDSGELEDGSLYIAMEYVQGEDLSRLLERAGKLPEKRAIDLAVQVLRSLEEAHRAGVVHRDIKPANVMVLAARDGSDWAKVVDFGIAKLSEGGGKREGNKITGVAEFVGTPNYCAPEQARGEPLDARTDLYAVGVMLFELVTGQPPYDGENPVQVISAHLTAAIPKVRSRNPEVSEDLERILERALAKRREDRFATAGSMRQALEALTGGRARTYTGETAVTVDGYAVARREDWDAFERTLSRGTRIRAWAGALLIGGLFAGGGAYAWRQLTTSAPEVPVTEEQEPNDDPRHANLVALDAPVTGSIGASTTAGKSDLDTYRLEVPGAGQLWVSVSGVSDLNLVVELFDPEKGAALSHVTVDDGRLGEGELLADVPVHAGRYYLRVSERPAWDEPDPSRPPRERAGAHYTLTAHLRPPTALDEHEPNDLWAAAQKVAVAQPVLGHAGVAVADTTLAKDVLLAAVDQFRGPLSKSGAIFVVQPPGRALSVRDAVLVERAKLAAQAAGAKLREAEARGEPTKKLAVPPIPAALPPSPTGVFALHPALENGEAGVLLVPGPGNAPGMDDAPYGVAFAEPGAGGLDGVLQLANVLAAADRKPQAKALLDKVLAELPTAVDLPRAKAQRDAL